MSIKKISKITWLILGAGVFLIAVVALVMVYHQQVGDQQQLNESMAVAEQAMHAARSQMEDYETRLPQLQGELAELDGRLTQAASLLAETKGIFPTALETIKYGDILFDIAGEHRLVITSLTGSQAGDIAVEGVTLSVVSFALHVEGGVADILGFIDTLANDRRFAGAAIGPVSMTIIEPLASATISIAVHSYGGG